VDTASDASAEITKAILVARNVNVLLDAELAKLYGVTTMALNQAVKRNVARFPEDFAFRLTTKETRELNKLRGSLNSQKHRDPLKPPFAFTEHGAIMLAMILKSTRAIEMSVFVVRAFARLRNAAMANEQLFSQLLSLEKRVGKHDADIEAILSAMKALIAPPSRSPRGIGFLADIK
jgi:phage regulator Rha-like protein